MIKYFFSYLTVSLFFLITVKLTAQNDPQFSFDKGVGIVAPDSSLSLHFQFNMQNRVELKTPSTENWTVDEFSAKIRRFRLKFSGFVLNPRLTYKIQLAMAPGNISSVTQGQAPRVMYDAMIYYQFNNRFSLGFGQTALPGNRDRINSSTSLQLVDRSLLNSTFNLDLDFGLQGKYKFNPGGQRPLVFHGAITTGEGKNWVVVEQAGFSYTGRLDWYPFGSFLKSSAYKEGDLEWHTSPRLMAGLSYNYNDRAQRAGGQRGGLLYANRDISTIYGDVIFKYRGWSIQGAFTTRDSEDPITFDPSGEQISYVYNGSGYSTQMSKYFRSDWELVGRLAGVRPGDGIQDLTPEQRDWTIGLNRYISGRAIKLQADATLHESRTRGTDFTGRFGFRLQAQVGF